MAQPFTGVSKAWPFGQPAITATLVTVGLLDPPADRPGRGDRIVATSS